MTPLQPPLTFSPSRRRTPGSVHWVDRPVHFAPYMGDWVCYNGPQYRPPEGLWRYDIEYHDTFVRVLGEDEPPPPPDLGVRFALGSAEATIDRLDGDPEAERRVEIPVFASAREDLTLLRLVLELDPTVATVEEMIVPVISDRTGETVDIHVPRGDGKSLAECTLEEDGTTRCTAGVPWYNVLLEVEPGRFLVEWLIPGSTEGRGFITEAPREIARLVLRMEEVPARHIAHLRPGRVEFGFATVSGGRAGR
jgi:hypothetical protein